MQEWTLFVGASSCGTEKLADFHARKVVFMNVFAALILFAKATEPMLTDYIQKSNVLKLAVLLFAAPLEKEFANAPPDVWGKSA